MKTVITAVICFVAAIFVASPELVEAQQCSTPKTVFQWVNFGPSSWGTVPISSPTICFSPRAVVDATGATHVYSVDVNSHLLEFFQIGIGAGWTTTDISAQTGLLVQGPPNGMFFGGTDIQVYAVSGFQLIAFVTTGNSHAYQAFNLTNLSSHTTVLFTMPMPILVGTTVHIYLPDVQENLHDYQKTITGQWQDVNLGSGLVGVPYAFGGNSIQLAARPVAGSDLWSLIELVNPDGSLTGSFSGFDLTSIAQGTAVSGFPSPLTVGAGNTDVAIYSDDTRGHLVEYFKTQSAQWIERDQAVLGQAGSTPSVLYFPGSGPNGTVKIFANVLSAGNGFLFEFDGDPVLGTLSGGPAFVGEGPIFSVPHAVLNNGTVEVFTLN